MALPRGGSASIVLLALGLVGACAYDLDPYQPDGAGAAGSTESAATSHAGAPTSNASTGTSSAGGAPSSTGVTVDAASASSGDPASSSSGGVEKAYPFCNDADPLDDGANWNDGNVVDFSSGHVVVGPDNGLSWVTWHDDLDLAPPCVFTTRLLTNAGVAYFGLRRNSSNQFYISVDDATVHGPNPVSAAINGALPMTLAIVVSGGAIISAFRDASGWHRLDSIGAPPWIGMGLRPVMSKSGDDLYATFDAYNADLLRPSDIGEPPLP